MPGRTTTRHRWFSTYVLSLVALVAVAAVASTNGVEPEQSSVSPQAIKARDYADDSRWDEALKAADALLKSDSEDAHAHVTRGIALNGLGKYEQAITELELATEIKGRRPEQLLIRADAFAHLSNSYFQQGEFLQAIDNAYFATLEKGDHALAHNNRANAYIAREQYDKAIGSARRAIEIDSSFAAAFSNRGFAYAKKGRLKPAIEDLTRAIELAPQLSSAYQRRGAAYAMNNQPNEALADLNKALELQPGMVDALCDRAWLFGLNGNMSRAMADLNQAVQVQPGSVRARIVRGRAFLQQEDFNAAIRDLDKAVSLDDSNADAWSYRGYAHHGKQQFADAVSDFTKAIELVPELQLAWKGRSDAHRKLGNRTAARSDRDQLKALTESSPEQEPTTEQERFIVASAAVDAAKREDAVRAAKKIDELVAANHAKHDVRPNALTTDSQFVRRIYLDITGTIPTYKQTRAFLNSKEEEKRVELIDDLLSSDGYASHSFNYWADVLRYTDRISDVVSGEPYRQWIKQSLAENKPWDQMVSELLTAEGLIWENPATGYLQRDANMPLDNMNNTVRIFLGTRIGCAQCHDHPFDRWTQKEFYQMAAFTYGTQTHTGGEDTRYWSDNPNDRLQEEYEEIEQEEEDRRRNSYRFKRLIRANMQIVNDRPGKTIKLPADYAYDNAKPGEVIAPATIFGPPARVQSSQPPRQAFAEWVTSKDNPRFALTIANRLWQRAFGIGQIEPVDDMVDATVAENPPLMAFLESEIKKNNFDMKQFMRMIFYSQSYQRQAGIEQLESNEPYHFPGPVLRRMTAEQLWDSFLTLAVVNPEEYRERPASVHTDVIGVDLSTVDAPDLLQAVHRQDMVNSGGTRWQREKKYRYKGALLARASELPSPVPANHFLRMFGQSDRELISASSTSGSVPQVLFMFNGPISHMILEKDSTMYNNVSKTRSVGTGIRTVFRTILSRDPDEDEMKLAEAEIKANGIPGYGNVIWALVNTREFLFIQ
jgi:tetratricopeptide (TPR) repeat protein